MKQVIMILFFSILLNKGIGQSTDSLKINPNPFNSSTTIYYYVANSDTATLEVFNNLGNPVKIFFLDSFVNAGSYSINYNTTSLPNGTYFFSLKVGTNNVNRSGVKNTSAGINQTVKTSEELIFYPNPAINNVTIEYSGLKKVVITNLDGKIIKSLVTSEKIISIADIKQGEFIIKIFSEENRLLATKKIIKVE